MTFQLTVKRGMITKATQGEPYTAPDGKVYPPTVKVEITDMENLSGNGLEVRVRETSFDFIVGLAFTPAEISGDFVLTPAYEARDGQRGRPAQIELHNLRVDPIVARPLNGTVKAEPSTPKVGT